MDSDDIRVRVYGDAATVTAPTAIKGEFVEQGFTTTERAADVFVKNDGSGHCVLSQLTRFSEK